MTIKGKCLSFWTRRKAALSCHVKAKASDRPISHIYDCSRLSNVPNYNLLLVLTDSVLSLLCRISVPSKFLKQ